MASTGGGSRFSLISAMSSRGALSDSKKLKKNPKERGHRCANPRGTRRAHPRRQDYDCWNNQMGENKRKQPWRAGVDEIMKPSNVQLK